MVKPAPFSRLQLAAALIEYDNDLSNPETTCRFAQDSAIFAHLRRNPRRSKDYLGVTVPSEAGSDPPQKKLRGSLGALRNPFESADDEEEAPENDGLEVDLTSWGLDAFIDRDKKGKGKARAGGLPNPHPAPLQRQSVGANGETAKGRGARSMSMGTLNNFGVGGAFLEVDQGNGPDSFGRLRLSTDLERMESVQPPLQRRRASAHTLIEGLPVQPPLHSVPFPSASVRSSSPGPEETLRPGSSRLDLQRGRVRTRSNASLGSKVFEEAVERSPSLDRASRFGIGTDHGRTLSIASVGNLASYSVSIDDNPFTVRPPSPSRSSRFDPKIRSRPASAELVGAQVVTDEVEVDSRRDRPYSTVELLRPKVLVMPSPLQTTTPRQAPQPQPVTRPRNGFVTSTDGPPLPPGARSARPASQLELSGPLIASNSFTPNPRASLSLSQLAFRNTLVVGGQRDISFSDIDRYLPRAEREGEQIKFDDEKEEEKDSPPPASIPLPPPPPPTEIELKRPAGKLYGWSLIDNLEHRKTEMKQKARVFRGDDRPSMMIRGQMRRSSTLIDPTTLGRPPSQSLGGVTQSLNRHDSSGPLVDLNGEKLPAASASEGYLPKTRSVFGVDTIWDREMTKLREIEAQEQTEAEERRVREQAGDKKKKNGKSKTMGSNAPSPGVAESAISAAPPTLPFIESSSSTRPPVLHEGESDTESNDDIPLGRVLGQTEKAADQWVTESSDEEDDGPRRTPGVGPRHPVKLKAIRHVPTGSDDSEEDLPLAATAARAARRTTQIPPPTLLDDDEDEDKPLSSVLSEGKRRLQSYSLDNLANGGRQDDDDDQPLGLRASRVSMAPLAPPTSTGGNEDDDKPLAFHPEQQRRTQYQMLVQMQQQQQMAMQARMTNSIYYGAPAMMGSGFFGPQMAPMMMGSVPMPAPSPPPLHDPAKFGRVDRWRRDVAVEGSE
ncbi:hypothetical protein EDC04DRAFT_2864320 [Pisolithus marmoratus]|nr:hypothetical protein EDC04DRAFT_2864320 [Pisolithus marmoratus]